MSKNFFLRGLLGLFLLFCLSYLSGLPWLPAMLHSKLEHHSKPEHHTEKGFRNPWKQDKKNFYDFLKWQWSRQKPVWPKDLTYPLLDLTHWETLKEDELEVYFIHHATFLIRLGSLTILTDPIFSYRPSPVNFLGPERSHPLTLELKDLPKIDIVLISHNHYDHLDLETVGTLIQKFNPYFVVPLKNKDLIEDQGSKKVVELDWWQSWAYQDLQIVLTPAFHWSARGLFDRFKSLWGGFSLLQQSQHKVYFAGDTGYAPFFKDIQSRYGSPLVSLLPIGASQPRWFMKDYHMNPEDALQAYKDLGTQYAVAAHWGSFNLSDEGHDEPKKTLEQLLTKPENQGIQFQALLPGTKLERR
jgi:L-ascorbate metabolism protein UlaG (beta-lactamase superfamily)